MTNEQILLIVISSVSALGTAIAAICAAISANYSKKSIETTIKLYKHEQKEKLIQEMNKIIEIGIQYPYLESKPFTSKWIENMNLNDERYLRYDMFCNLIFNYLNHVYNFFGKDKKLIEDFVDIKSWIRLHKYCWQNPIDENENIDAYDEDFRKFINSYIHT